MIHAWIYPYLGYRTSTHEPREMMALDAAKVLESTVNGPSAPMLRRSRCAPTLPKGSRRTCFVKPALAPTCSCSGRTAASVTGLATSHAVLRKPPCPVTVVPG